MKGLALALILGLVAGCATFEDAPLAPPSGVTAVEGGLPVVGTRWVLKHTSFNENTGKTQVSDTTWTVLEEGDHDGRPVVRLWDGHHLHVHDRATGSWVGMLDRDSRPLISHTPHDGAASAPWWVGKQWVARSTRHEHLRGQTHHNVVIVWKVPALDTVAVPAGTYRAFRVEAWPDARDPVKKRIYWYAPDLKVVIKEQLEGYGRPYDIGFGRDRVKVTSELVSYSTPGAAVPILIAAVRNPATRLETLWQLRRIGRPAREAMPVVIDVLRSEPSGIVRGAAAHTVRALGITAADVPALARSLGDREIEVRAVLSDILKPHTPAVVEALTAALGDADAGVRGSASRGLGSLGPAASAAAEALRRLADGDPSPDVRDAAQRALEAIAPR